MRIRAAHGFVRGWLRMRPASLGSQAGGWKVGEAASPAGDLKLQRTIWNAREQMRLAEGFRLSKGSCIKSRKRATGPVKERSTRPFRGHFQLPRAFSGRETHTCRDRCAVGLDRVDRLGIMRWRRGAAARVRGVKVVHDSIGGPGHREARAKQQLLAGGAKGCRGLLRYLSFKGKKEAACIQ